MIMKKLSLVVAAPFLLAAQIYGASWDNNFHTAFENNITLSNGESVTAVTSLGGVVLSGPHTAVAMQDA
jgi:hypothetical protein